jgi:integrase
MCPENVGRAHLGLAFDIRDPIRRMHQANPLVGYTADRFFHSAGGDLPGPEDWTRQQMGEAFRIPDQTKLRSRRNRALLSLLIGCGLRRAGITTLRFEDFQLREGHWAIADLRGKGGHIRTIPVPEL